MHLQKYLLATFAFSLLLLLASAPAFPAYAQGANQELTSATEGPAEEEALNELAQAGEAGETIYGWFRFRSERGVRALVHRLRLARAPLSASDQKAFWNLISIATSPDLSSQARRVVEEFLTEARAATSPLRAASFLASFAADPERADWDSLRTQMAEQDLLLPTEWRGQALAAETPSLISRFEAARAVHPLYEAKLRALARASLDALMASNTTGETLPPAGFRRSLEAYRLASRLPAIDLEYFLRANLLQRRSLDGRLGAGTNTPPATKMEWATQIEIEVGRCQLNRGDTFGGPFNREAWCAAKSPSSSFIRGEGMTTVQTSPDELTAEATFKSQVYGGYLNKERDRNIRSLGNYQATGTLVLPRCTNALLCSPVLQLRFAAELPPDYDVLRSTRLKVEVASEDGAFRQQLNANTDYSFDRSRANLLVTVKIDRYDRHEGGCCGAPVNTVNFRLNVKAPTSVRDATADRTSPAELAERVAKLTYNYGLGFWGQGLPVAGNQPYEPAAASYAATLAERLPGEGKREDQRFSSHYGRLFLIKELLADPAVQSNLPEREKTHLELLEASLAREAREEFLHVVKMLRKSMMETLSELRVRHELDDTITMLMQDKSFTSDERLKAVFATARAQKILKQEITLPSAGERRLDALAAQLKVREQLGDFETRLVQTVDTLIAEEAQLQEKR